MEVEHCMEAIESLVKNTEAVSSPAHVFGTPKKQENFGEDNDEETPTKVLDYMSLGIPVLCNSEIYDQHFLVSKSGCGSSVKYDVNVFGKEILALSCNLDDLKKRGINGRKWLLSNGTFTSQATNLVNSNNTKKIF